MERSWTVGVGLASLQEALRDLLLRLAEDDACLALTLGLRLARHGVLQLLRNNDVADFDTLHRDSPRFCSGVNDLLQLAVNHVPPDQDVCQILLADDVAQRGLRRPGDGLHVALHLQSRFLRIPHEPEQHGVDVDRHGIPRQGFLGRERRYHHAMVHPSGDRVHDGDDPEQPRALKATKSPEAQHNGLLPLVGDLDGEQQVESNQQTDYDHGPDLPIGDIRISQPGRQQAHQGQHDEESSQGHRISDLGRQLRPTYLIRCFLTLLS